MNDELLNSKQAAEFLGVAFNTLRYYRQIGFLKPSERSTTGSGRYWLYKKSDLQTLINTSRTVTPTKFTSQGRSAYRNIERQLTPETRPTGCVIHWDELHISKGSIHRLPITCAKCGNQFEKTESHLKTAIRKGEFTGCCPNCYASARRPNKILPSNGTFVRDGYRWRYKRTFTTKELEILLPMMNPPYYIPEHRAIVALALGRHLTRNESVHHINGDKLDNRLENLQIFNKSEHSMEHAKFLRREIELRSQVKNLTQTVLILSHIIMSNCINQD